MPSENDYARRGYIPLGPANKRKRTQADASRAIRRGGRDLSDLTGNPDDADIRPVETEAQRRLKRRLGS